MKNNDHEVARMYMELLRRAGNYTWAKGKKMSQKDIKNELFKLAKEKGVLNEDN